jgi:two-component system response regulator PilR (NtrC family)
MSGHAGRLLIAEDEAETRLLLKRTLTREGFDVAVAADGGEALEILRADDTFDVLVSDVRMPVRDGLELLKEVRRLRPKLRVVLVTAYLDVQQYYEVMKSGAFEYLSKPFKIPDLLEVLDRAMEK